MTDGQIEILRAEAERWRGTPFRARSCACGPRGGVDCIRYAAALYQATGHIQAIEWPRYHIDSGSHLSVSPLLEFLRGRAPFADSPRVAVRFEELGKEETKAPGDLIIFREGRVEYHVGVVLTEGDFTHVLIGGEVTTSSLRDSTYSGHRLQALFRPLTPKEAA